jgi:hypothetical protein
VKRQNMFHRCHECYGTSFGRILAIHLTGRGNFSLLVVSFSRRAVYGGVPGTGADDSQTDECYTRIPKSAKTDSCAWN